MVKSKPCFGFVEAVIEDEVLPVVGGGGVHFDVERAELGDVGGGVIGVMELAHTI